jgi:hypothetical protein
MPVVIPAEKGTPLQQGDILEGIALAVGDSNGNLMSVGERGLVLSRNCNALRDSQIVVASVIRQGLPETPSSKTFDNYRRYLARLRDGDGSPDRVYLGTFDEQNPSQRYSAKLDSIHTIMLPDEKNAAERQRWVDEHRKYCLHGDFLRDLHVRFTLAFCRLGFDDDGWYSDSDLDLLLRAGEVEMSSLNRSLAETKESLSKKKLEMSESNNPGAGGVKKAIEGLEKELKNQEEKMKDLEGKLAPLIREKERRSQAK